MLSRGNDKLGRSIYHWSIPAITTCPGATEACKALCYASKGRFRASASKNNMARNYKLSKSKYFAEAMICEIQAMRHPIIRIHVAGDFYNQSYIQKWIRIVKECPHATFFAYTRSWRRPELLPLLLRLGSLPNMRLWLSADRLGGEPPRLGLPIAYMSIDDNDIPPWPVNLVFRAQRKTQQKFMNGYLVCPVEQGVNRQTHITCTKCRLCFQRLNHPHLQKEGASLIYKEACSQPSCQPKGGALAETRPLT